MKNILVIGESCMDVFHYGSCLRLCPEAPVPVFSSHSIEKNGGMAMNTYNNILSLGGSVNIVTNHNWKDITKTRFVDRRTNHMFMRLDENDLNFDACNLKMIDYSFYDAIVVSDYNKGFLSKDQLVTISQNSKLSFLDTKKILGPWAMDFDFIKINNSEFEKSKDFLDKTLLDKLIVTQGPHGCTYGGVKYPVQPVEVKDTSGAGDTFLSGFCVEYCESQNICQSIRFANECATKVVQKIGVAVV